MPYELRWLQHRDGAQVPQTHPFDDLDEAKEFAEGLGSDAHAEIFDTDPQKTKEDQEPVWSADAPQATGKERDASRAAAVVGKSEGLGGNTKPDTREDKPEDLRKELSGAAGASGSDSSKSGSVGSTQGKPGSEADAGESSRDGSRNRGLSQDGSLSGTTGASGSAGGSRPSGAGSGSGGR